MVLHSIPKGVRMDADLETIGCIVVLRTVAVAMKILLVM